MAFFCLFFCTSSIQVCICKTAHPTLINSYHSLNLVDVHFRQTKGTFGDSPLNYNPSRLICHSCDNCKEVHDHKGAVQCSKSGLNYCKRIIRYEYGGKKSI